MANLGNPLFKATHEEVASDGSVMPYTTDERGTILPAIDGIVDRIKTIQNLELRDDDILICTYPKSGTHWAGNIAEMLLKKEEIKAPDWDGVPSIIFLEKFDPESYVDKPSPRIFCTHLLPEYLPLERIASGKGKLMYVTRNPKDTIVSYYHHMLISNGGMTCKGSLNGIVELFLQGKSKAKMMFVTRNPKDTIASFYHMLKNMGPGNSYKGSLFGLAELFLQGKSFYGDWFNHKDIYTKFVTDNKERFLSLVFEDMKKDPRETVRQIAAHINVEVTEEEITLILELSSVTSMRNRLIPKGGMLAALTKTLFRKGEVDDWKNHFTVATNEMFDREWARRMEERGEQSS